MAQKTLGIICALFIALGGDGIATPMEPDPDVPPWLPKLAPGEDALVANRNAFMNKMAEHFDKRVTIVKFDDDLETKCPILTSLFSSTGHRLEWLTPNFSLYEATIYLDGRGRDASSVNVVVQNASCRYVLTVKRYERNGEEEKEVQVRDVSRISSSEFKPHPARPQDQQIGFHETVVPFLNPSKPLDFTGIAFFTPTTFTVSLANVEKDMKIASESNFLTHTYKIEIKNAQAALRISINKELYSDGQWVNAYN